MKQGLDLLVKLEKLKVYNCEKCSRVFSTMNDLMKHMSYHNEVFLSHVFSAYVPVERAKIFKCGKCTQSFDNNRDFMLHKLAHVQANVKNERRVNKFPMNPNIVKPHKCPDCDVSFAAKSTLDAHSILHLPFPHICKCGIGYYEEQDLRYHIKLVHGPDKEADETELVVPQRKPEVIPQSKPEVKPKSKPKSKSGNRKTINKKSVKKEKPKKNWKVKLKFEDENTNGIDLKPKINIRKTCNNKFECPECKKEFAFKAYVFQHYRIHTGERPFECHLCHKAFNQAITLKKHIERHLCKERIYVCQHCPKAFTLPYYRDRHELIHSAVKPHMCPYCCKRFHDQSALIRHKRIHTGDKRYRCSYCPKAFSDVSALIGHKLRHEKKKLFSCEICDKRFYNRNDVNKHMTAIHTKKKYFTCDYCKRSLSLKYDLMMHILQKHMNIISPFECERCHKKYFSKENLARHVRAKHEKTKTKLFHKSGNNEEHSKKENQKHLQCAKCLQYFASPTHFEEHKLLESVQCEICDEKFFCENMLEKHFEVHLPKTVKQKSLRQKSESDTLKEI